MTKFMKSAITLLLIQLLSISPAIADDNYCGVVEKKPEECVAWDAFNASYKQNEPGYLDYAFVEKMEMCHVAKTALTFKHCGGQELSGTRKVILLLDRINIYVRDMEEQGLIVVGGPKEI